MEPHASNLISEILDSLKFVQELSKRFNVTILRENPEDPKIRLTPSTGVSVADIRNSLFDGLLEKIDEELEEKGLPWRALFNTDYDKGGQCAIAMRFSIPGESHLPDVRLGKDADQEDDYEVVKSAVEKTSFHMAIHPIPCRTPNGIYGLLLENGLPKRYFFRRKENIITSPRNGVIVEIVIPDR